MRTPTNPSHKTDSGSIPLKNFVHMAAGNEVAERLAYFGLSVNMVAFMFYVMHRPFTSAANAVNTFLGISQASSVIGGFLADAYLGRYWTIAIFATVYLIVSGGLLPAFNAFLVSETRMGPR